jgi:hypothetical protein
VTGGGGGGALVAALWVAKKLIGLFECRLTPPRKHTTSLFMSDERRFAEIIVVYSQNEAEMMRFVFCANVEFLTVGSRDKVAAARLGTERTTRGRFVFVCGLFNDAISSRHDTAPNYAVIAR